MKLIPLTQGLFAKVDDEDFEYLNQFKWYAQKRNNGYTASRSGLENGKRVAITMHRVIMNVTDPNLVVDHIDHEILNNQKYNLRTCTIAQNNTNIRSHRDGSSKYLGVSWHKLRRKWVANVQKNRKIYHLGAFDDEKEAALAYNRKALELHGEFANPNII